MTGLLIGEVFRSAARAVPHRTAALVGDRALTFAELDAAADRTARHLAAHGVRRGDRVVCPVAASPETLAAFAAAARAGAVFVPVDAGSGDAWAGRVARIVRAARPRLLVTDAARAGSGARLAAGSGVRHVVLADVGEDGVPDDKAEGPPAARPEESDPHVILFTEPTGTPEFTEPTGTPEPDRPRGVVLSHRVNALRTHPGCRPAPRGPLVCGLPLERWAAWAAVLRQWQARGTVVLPTADGAPNPAAICAAVRAHRAEGLVCAPSAWEGVLDTAPHLLARLRYADVESERPAAVEPCLLEAVRTATPAARARAVLGSAETGDLAVLEHADGRGRPGSCGVPAPGSEVRVAGGELYVRGPLLFGGYFEDRRATAAVLRDGWFRTGRAAALDGDGYLYLRED
ncbi:MULTISPECIES: AMP-binding protein [Streptomyces]|uniref:AMP-dependent synthetase/ligase domain-containing protein n=1 Tax=Streptomyces alboflavus TaxID=67267 RepID=A0A1Z1W8D2_9ACTN|nr:AMP-binding protein [Streptomyces alboflavus]ARX82674.1 hypothetical protein SMD44_02087 [Streptomyces alboflavus]